MSFTWNYKEGLEPVAIVKKQLGTKEGGSRILYIDPDERDGIKNIELSDGYLQPLPNEKNKKQFISGSSGSGKSVFVARYIRELQKIYKKKKIYFFSQLEEDPVIDELKLIRVSIDADIVDNPPDIKNFEHKDGSLLVFDDFDTLTPPILKQLMVFINMVLSCGRHYNIECIITSHLSNRGAMYRNIMLESQTFTVYPGSSNYFITYMLKQYMGITDKKIINDILHARSRWVMLYRNYPQLYITENKAVIL